MDFPVGAEFRKARFVDVGGGDDFVLRKGHKRPHIKVCHETRPYDCYASQSPALEIVGCSCVNALAETGRFFHIACQLRWIPDDAVRDADDAAYLYSITRAWRPNIRPNRNLICPIASGKRANT